MIDETFICHKFSTCSKDSDEQD